MMRLILLLVSLVMSAEAHAASYVPDRANRYKDDLIREARFVGGINAPVAMFGSQIHQESGWKPEAKSLYAAGLTQFTPDTADWIAKTYPELGKADVYNPLWAIRALVRYDYRLNKSNAIGKTDCDDWSFALTGYNGGDGWNIKDRKKAKALGMDPTIYWGSVELVNSGRREDFFKENRGYPERILKRHQPNYRKFFGVFSGPQICQFSKP